jgi:hypothetical protein
MTSASPAIGYTLRLSGPNMHQQSTGASLLIYPIFEPHKFRSHPLSLSVRSDILDDHVDERDHTGSSGQE